VYSAVSKKGVNGPSVTIKDVLDKKEGKEVWVVIKGEVYKCVLSSHASPRVDRGILTTSMTEFLEDHPGGSEIILNNRSKDVTHIFNPRHPSDQLDEQNLPPNVHHLGVLSTEGASEEEKEALLLKVSKDEEDEEARIKKEREAMEERGLGVIINMKDFEVRICLL
jgi:hypothetical protein